MPPQWEKPGVHRRSGPRVQEGAYVVFAMVSVVIVVVVVVVATAAAAACEEEEEEEDVALEEKPNVEKVTIRLLSSPLCPPSPSYHSPSLLFSDGLSSFPPFLFYVLGGSYQDIYPCWYHCHSS